MADDPARQAPRTAEQKEQRLTVAEYAYVVREHPRSVYRRIKQGRQGGVHRDGGRIRLDPPETT